MGETTAIAWCHATFNPWWGCVEVSPACDHCYARTDAKRYGHAVWGKDAARRFFGDHHWNEPIRWNRKAIDAGERRRVFCASMADVFEERDDKVGHLMALERARLWDIIAATPALDWLLLTKRPAGMRRLLPATIAALTNVWPGVTVESPAYLWRLDELQATRTAGPHWVSYEPALAWVDFAPHFAREPAWWVIGGESGPHARPFNVAWVRLGIAQCRAYGVAPFVKQFGAHPFSAEFQTRDTWIAVLEDRKGADMGVGMIKICARCCQPLTFLDVVTYARGEFAKHTAFCPPGWGAVDWRTALKENRCPTA